LPPNSAAPIPLDLPLPIPGFGVVSVEKDLLFLVTSVPLLEYDCLPFKVLGVFVYLLLFF